MGPTANDRGPYKRNRDRFDNRRGGGNVTKETDLERGGQEATGRDAGATKTGESGTGLPEGLQREFSPADTRVLGLLAQTVRE